MVSARRGLKVRNLTKTCIALERHVLGVQTYFARHQKRPLTLILNKFHFTLYQYLMQLFFCDTFTHDSISSKIDEEEEDLGKLE
jgi:hypothetical protein